jgi:hypothetical protein
MNISDVKRQIFVHHDNYQYRLFNSYIFPWESDFFAMAKQTDYCIEIEIKMSRADFKADFEKNLTYKSEKKHTYLQDSLKLFKPNKFAFACPEGLILPDELPSEYGLFYASEKKNWMECIRAPKFLHKEKLLKDNHFCIQMMRKFYYRNIDLRSALDIREYDIKYGQKNIDYRNY